MTTPLSKILIQRPVAVTMLTIGVVVFGFVSLQKLSMSLMPDIRFPTLTVRTEFPGTAPEEVEALVTKKLETGLSVLSGLQDYHSVSKAGISEIILEFHWKTDLTFAVLQVRENIDRVVLPADVKKPMILKYDPTEDPILRIALYGSRPLEFIQATAKNTLETSMQTIPGVASVKIRGGLEKVCPDLLCGLAGKEVPQVY